MKKHLLTAAVATAIAAPATAQNVTVYGRLDVGAANKTNGAVAAASYSDVTSSMMTTSRLGFAGSEDLGGGLKAVFKAETTMGIDSGKLGDTLTQGANQGIKENVATGSSTTIATGGSQQRIFDRDLYVGLEGGFGKVWLGHQETLLNKLDANYNQTGSNIILFGNVENPENNDRRSNTISYWTPTVNGFSGAFMYSPGENTSGLSTNSATQYQVNYANGPLSVSYVAADANNTSNEKVSDNGIGASYNFGMATVGLTMQNSKDVSGDKSRATLATVKVPMGKITLLGGVAQVKVDQGYANTGTSNVVSTSGGKATAKQTTIGATYALSKRTYGYAMYSKIDNNANSKYVSGTAYFGQADAADPSITAIGIVHQF